jgi:hypothetical protein
VTHLQLCDILTPVFNNAQTVLDAGVAEGTVHSPGIVTPATRSLPTVTSVCGILHAVHHLLHVQAVLKIKKKLKTK